VSRLGVPPALREVIAAVALIGLVAPAALPQAAGPGQVRAGAAAIELEADDSMVIGGGIGPGRAHGQEGKLRVVATVIEGSDGGRAALIACDVLMIERDYLDPAARSIESELKIPFQNILINATHTHHAPTTVTIHGYERDAKFCSRVRDGIVAAARAAAARIAPSGGACDAVFRLGEESSVGQNSRILLSDGSIFWVGRRDDEVRPTGPFDPELPVLAFRRPGGGYESVIFNHSTHCIGAYDVSRRSPGFYCLAAQELEPELGGTVTFVAGAFGSTHNLVLKTPEMVHRLKAAVRDALESAAPMRVGVVRGLKKEVTYRVRVFDEAREDEAVSKYVRSRTTGDPTYTIEVFRKMRKELARHQGEERRTWLQALRIGDVVWVGVPGELFTRLGIEIKRRSPFRYTYVAGVANDYVGYIPDATGHDLGGYQTWTGFHSLVEKGTGERFVAQAVELLRELQTMP